MAINKVDVKGYVVAEPKFLITERGPRLEIVLSIDRTDEIKKKEPLTIITEQKEMVGRLLKDQLQVGDFFVGNGILHTFNYEKVQTIVCPHCHEQTKVLKRAEILNVDIEEYRYFRKQQDYEIKGQNSVIIRGTLYDDPKVRVRENGNHTSKYAKFKMKVKREKQPGGDYAEYDYPFAVGFGRTAEYIENTLHRGDEILITGSVQERTYMKLFPDMVCEKCRYEISPRLNEYTREIIIDRIEVLKKAEHNQ